jgi:hypothetical protein
MRHGGDAELGTCGASDAALDGGTMLLGHVAAIVQRRVQSHVPQARFRYRPRLREDGSHVPPWRARACWTRVPSVATHEGWNSPESERHEHTNCIGAGDS